MKLVIDIPEEYYKAIMEIPVNQSTADMLIIRNGISLPKGHGRLIDADEYERIIRTYIDKNKNSGDIFLAGCGDGAYHAMCMLKDISTIIEADAPKRRKCTPLEENDSGYNCENWIP